MCNEPGGSGASGDGGGAPGKRAETGDGNVPGGSGAPGEGNADGPRDPYKRESMTIPY